MASNTNLGFRKGPVKNRSQVYNPSTGNYIKRDTLTGKFIDVKTDGKPFKGVSKENKNIKGITSTKKDFANLAEKAVINFRNKKLAAK